MEEDPMEPSDLDEATEVSVPVVRIMRDGPVGRIVLNRPQVHNAFDEQTIHSVTAAAEVLEADKDIRAVVLEGRGKCFCAGADIDYMRRTGEFDWDASLADAGRLSGMFKALEALTKPLLARVHGPAFGGGVGLAASADLVFVGPKATFALSEVKLGLVPAVIGPYVQRRIGATRARGLFSTGVRINAREAVHMGLADMLCDSDDEMDQRIEATLNSAVACGPRAVARSRALPEEIAGKDPKDIADAMAEVIAGTRAGSEAKEGLGAFLEKRRALFARSLS